MKCLDTDLLVAILRGKAEVRDKVVELDSEGKEATTSINAFELFFGAHRSMKANENVKETAKLLGRLEIIPLDFTSSRKAAEIAARLAVKGEAIDFRDAMIAGIAIENNLTLLTRNRHHFGRIEGLKLELW